MGSYYYVKDKDSEFGYTPIPEDEYVQTLFRVAKRQGLNITDAMILEEVEKMNKKSKKNQSNLTRSKKNSSIVILKSPALVR